MVLSSPMWERWILIAFILMMIALLMTTSWAQCAPNDLNCMNLP